MSPARFLHLTTLVAAAGCAGAVAKAPPSLDRSPDVRPARPRGGSTFIELRFVRTGLSDKGDARHVTAACGRCGAELASRVETCPDSVCGASLRWRTRRIKCQFCCPRDELEVAGLDQIPENDRDGFCAYCGGSGKHPSRNAETERLPFGLTRSPGSGVRPGACPICKGSAKCMRCMGTGWMDVPETFGE